MREGVVGEALDVDFSIRYGWGVEMDGVQRGRSGDDRRQRLKVWGKGVGRG